MTENGKPLPPLNKQMWAGCLENDAIELMIQNMIQLWSSDTLLAFLAINMTFIGFCLNVAVEGKTAVFI